MIIFDMDGVLLDSEKTLVHIYRSLGVDPPERLFEAEGSNWLEKQQGPNFAKIYRNAKDEMYARAIASGTVKRLPAFNVACTLARNNHEVGLVTSAAWSAIQALWQTTSWWPFLFATAKIRPENRVILCAQLGVTPIYVDDQRRSFMGAHHVHSAGKDETQLLQEILQWTSV